MPVIGQPSGSGLDFSWLSNACNFHGYITCSGCGPDTPHYANDVQTPCGTRITALFDGTVSDARCTPWGYQLFVTMNNGMQYYYYHLQQLNVTPGQFVRAGQFVGYSGGDPNNTNQPCVPSSTWTTGCHTHVGFFTGFKNGIPYGPDITPYLSQIRQGIGQPSCSSATIPGSSTLIGASATLIPTVAKNAYQVITATSPITDLFIFFDDICQIINPFNVTPHFALGGIGGLLDPVDATIQILLNIAGDFVATAIRLIMFLLGMYILFKVANALVNITGKIQWGAKAVTSAAAVGLI
jgi:Peptidase family M23